MLQFQRKGAAGRHMERARPVTLVGEGQAFWQAMIGKRRADDIPPARHHLSLGEALAGA